MTSFLIKLWIVIPCCFLGIKNEVKNGLYCLQHQTELVVSDSVSCIIDYDLKCYKSEFRMDERRGKILLTTDSVRLAFVIVTHTTEENKGYLITRFIVVIPGDPNQLYALREVRKDNYYFFSCTPTQFNKKMGRIKGISLKVSTQPICQ